MGVDLSIVIPVYNVERYLEDCLNSLLRVRRIEDAEIILIDDGSTDNSSYLVDEYSRRYDNILSYHIDNSGPSVARNYGIQIAGGKYIFFCDSDDLVVPEVFSKVIDIISHSEVDMVLWDAVLVDEQGQLSKRKDREYYVHRGLDINNDIISGKKVIEYQLLTRGDYPATVWLGLYARRFLLEYNLLFEKGILHEDELWAQKALLCARSVIYVPEKAYLYRIHEGSITNPEIEDWTKHIESLFNVYPSLFLFSDEHLSGDAIKPLFDADMAHRYLYMIFKYDFYKYGYGKRIDKKQLWIRSRSIKDKIKIIILLLKELFYQ
ncbi:MAG: glycosyltransferase [Clostridiales bacterium]|nr:glycosyltransferase [Clostridiales bacterium]